MLYSLVRNGVLEERLLDKAVTTEDVDSSPEMLHRSREGKKKKYSCLALLPSSFSGIDQTQKKVSHQKSRGCGLSGSSSSGTEQSREWIGGVKRKILATVCLCVFLYGI